MTKPVVVPPAWAPGHTSRLRPGDDPAPGDVALVSELALEAQLTAPHEARDLVRELGTRWGLPVQVCDDAVSITSELVTNAVVHARSSLHLVVELRLGVLTITVSDASRRRLRAVEPGASDVPEHGVGLWIVDHLAESWGTLNTRDGKSVWATLVVPSP